jgi:hypothetical protein
LAEAQAKIRTTQLLAPLDSANPYPQEFSKGEIAGIRLFIQLPEMTIESLKEQLKESEESDEPTE